MISANPSPGKTLRNLLTKPDHVLAVFGAPDAASVKLMGAAGIEAAFVGTGITASRYTGLSDTGVVSSTEALWIASFIARAASFPIILDGDTGHGGPPAVKRLVEECVRIGLAGLRLDDQEIEAKRGTQSAGIEIVSREHAVERYRAAVEARDQIDPDFVIMAQCYARDAVNGSMDELLVRLPLYESEGRCDWVQFESPHSTEELRQARQAVRGPLSAMRGKLPRTLNLEEHRELGLNAAWYTGWPGAVLNRAMRAAMDDYTKRGIEAFLDSGDAGPAPAGTSAIRR